MQYDAGIVLFASSIIAQRHYFNQTAIALVSFHARRSALLIYVALQVVEILTQELLDIVDNLKGGILGEGHSWA